MVRAAVASVAVFLGGCLAGPEPDPHIPKEEWAFVCSSLLDMGYDKVDCSKTPRPVVVASAVVEEVAPDGWMLYGFTVPGEGYIFVNVEVDPEMWAEIRVHEATHYLLVQTYGLGMIHTAVSDCESEQAAREVGSKFSGEPVDPDWIAEYKCTEELSR